MKREIWCKGCDYTLGTYQGEGHKKIPGQTKMNLTCDLCGTFLPYGADAVAVSMFMDGEYFQWEDEYIERR